MSIPHTRIQCFRLLDSGLALQILQHVPVPRIAEHFLNRGKEKVRQFVIGSIGMSRDHQCQIKRRCCPTPIPALVPLHLFLNNGTQVYPRDVAFGLELGGPRAQSLLLIDALLNTRIIHRYCYRNFQHDTALLSYLDTLYITTQELNLLTTDAAITFPIPGTFTHSFSSAFAIACTLGKCLAAASARW